jgi:hypothetical protein
VTRATRLLAGGAAFAALATRRPDALVAPQLFAEAGAVYFQQAHTQGWAATLFHTQAGYFTLLPRLVTGAAALVPLRALPLVENLVALAIQTLVVILLLSPRTRGFGAISLRALMAVLYVALPNASEAHAEIVNSQWHLALVAALVVLAAEPRSPLGKLLDSLVVLLSGMTGPFAILLLPVAAARWWKDRQRWHLWLGILVAATAAAQAAALVTHADGTRLPVGLGATPRLLIELMGGHFFTGALLGETGPAWLHLPAIGLGLLLLAYCVVTATFELRLLTLFALLVFAASLKSPLLSGTMPQWEALRVLPVGIRYWLFPEITVAWALAWTVRMAPTRPARTAAAVALTILLIGAVRHWQYPPYPDVGFARHAEEYEAAPPGALVSIPVVPTADWDITIVRHGTMCRITAEGAIDQPLGDPVGDLVPLTGWVTAPGEIRSVALVINGRVVGAARPTIARPDVDRLWPRRTQPLKGWTLTADLTSVGPGTYELHAWATRGDGCVGIFTVRTMTKGSP